MGRVTPMSVEVEVVRGATDEVVEVVSRLLPQLSRTAGTPDRESVARLLGSDATTLLLARVEGRAVGMLTLIVFPLLSGTRGRIEDVVVDEAARGHGVGAALTEEALRLAEEAGVRTVDLTSRPSRRAANRLYERLGFQARDSTVYRFMVQP
ncbi:GNAT family N-acetyltransferase [Streptomyces sp. NPDC088139]|uniref:GNAT family N-acetyltransferase n=1 Tax=Streptomyces sp. NPDC088139 TaxID=3365828 RepID=UPI0037FEC03A